MTTKEEWIAVMVELAAVDREEYRRVRALAWAAIAEAHGTKTDEELAVWQEKAS